MSVGMYVAYIPQIADNLSGHKGNPVQPFVAFVNCSLWTIYGLFKKQRDWPIVVANVPGIFLGLAAFFTALQAFSGRFFRQPFARAQGCLNAFWKRPNPLFARLFPARSAAACFRQTWQPVSAAETECAANHSFLATKILVHSLTHSFIIKPRPESWANPPAKQSRARKAMATAAQ